MAEFTNMYLQRLGHKHINFVWAGGYIGSWMQFGTPDWVKGYVPIAAAGLERDAAGGKLVQCGGDAMMGSGSGIPGGGGTGLEQFVSYDPDDKASTHAAYLHMEDAVKDAASIGYPPGKEWQYLQMGWSDERFEQVMAAARSPTSSASRRGSGRRSIPTASETACIRHCRCIPAQTAPMSGRVRRTPLWSEHDGC